MDKHTTIRVFIDPFDQRFWISKGKYWKSHGNLNTWVMECGADIQQGVEYEVSNKPIEGGSVLQLHDEGSFAFRYDMADGITLWFCKRDIKALFGTAPEKIYYKEVWT
jgi:hypothetical protein